MIQKLGVIYSLIPRLLRSQESPNSDRAAHTRKESGSKARAPGGAGLGSTMTNRETLLSRHVWGGMRT